MLRQLMAAASIAVACVVSFSPAAHAQEARPGDGAVLELAEGDVALTDVIARWGSLTKRLVTIDSQITPIRLQLAAPTRLDATTLRQVLDFHDVVLVERDGVIQAHHRRNLNQKCGPPWDLVEGLAPDDDRLVTAVVPIRHGSGSSIFATVRGLLVRDMNRLANLLYVQGPELIVILDVAHNVRYYQDVISRLDQPAPAPQRRSQVTVYEVQRAAWTRLQATAPAAPARAEALRAAAADAATGVVQLAQGQFLASEPVNIQREVTDGREQLGLSLDLVGPTPKEGASAPTGEELDLCLRLTIVGPEGRNVLTLTTRTRVTQAGGPVVQSFSGRGGPQPTDVVVVLE